MSERELLIDLRSKLVGAMHVQPFTIYTDETILELLKHRPKTIAELEKVKGFPKGGKRVKGFGEAVVAIFSGKKIERFEITGSAKSNDVAVNTKLQKMEVF